MAGIVFHSRNTQIRVYDGTSGGTPPGPFYFNLPFVRTDMVWMSGRNRGEQFLKLNRGVLDASAHYVQGSDADILSDDHVITFSIELLDTTYLILMAALSNIFRISPWTVGNQTWVNTNASTQIRNGDGTLVTTPTTAEPLEDRVNIEIRQIAKSAGANDLVMKLNEIWFPPRQSMAEAFEGNAMTVSGIWKGDVTTGTAFTTGTDTEA